MRRDDVGSGRIDKVLPEVQRHDATRPCDQSRHYPNGDKSVRMWQTRAEIRNCSVDTERDGVQPVADEGGNRMGKGIMIIVLSLIALFDLGLLIACSGLENRGQHEAERKGADDE